MILIKRYGFPLVLSFALYSVIYLIFGMGSPYFGIGLALSVLLSYFIRICDDILDYKKDRAAKKAPIRKGILTLMGAVVLFAFVILTFIKESHLMFIPPAIIAAQFLINEKYRDFIKPLFLPATVITLVFSFFTPSLWLLALVPILTVSDIVLIVYKRHRRNR